jgi:hypothetical protein
MKPLTQRLATAIATVYSLLVLAARSSAADVDTVSREIRYEKGAIRVEDKLNVRKTLANRDPALEALFDSAREGKTNLLRHVRALLDGESLEVEKHTVKVQGDFVEVRISSKVIFNDPDRPAKLKWIPTWAGATFNFPNGSIGRPAGGLEMLIFENNQHPTLWFPELGSAQVSLTGLDSLVQLIEWIGGLSDEPFEYICDLKIGARSERLLHWHPTRTPSIHSETVSVVRMNKMKRMLLNDIVTLCTSLKVAKSGYYAIRAYEAPERNPQK